ncbi:hypothetical protein [uncultured Aquimarina sp.]|uniref:hypothetical protein n=1 Tax=uncultured Aquimarina sp. TaxID=575652 RepID=UPI002614CFF5|nr:hypothetical protein [uncultured Aquimarina sp.]
MISDKKKKYLKLVLVIFCLFILTPVILIIYHFHNQEVSSNITDWGALGDYIGGFVNTIISFISLVVLGILTYLVGKQSNEENKRVNVLMRKLDAYNELTKYLPKINQHIPEWANSIKIIDQMLKDTESITNSDYLERRNQLIKELKLFPEFHYFLFNFNLQFGHLFEYNFSNKDHKDLINSSSKICNFYNSIITSLELSETQSFEKPNIELFFDKLTILVNKLRNELSDN